MISSVECAETIEIGSSCIFVTAKIRSKITRRKKRYVLVVWKCLMARVGLVVGGADNHYSIVHDYVPFLQIEICRPAFLLLGRRPSR